MATVRLCNPESDKCSVIPVVWHMMDGRMSHTYISDLCASILYIITSQSLRAVSPCSVPRTSMNATFCVPKPTFLICPGPGDLRRPPLLSSAPGWSLKYHSGSRASVKSREQVSEESLALFLLPTVDAAKSYNQLFSIPRMIEHGHVSTPRLQQLKHFL